MGGGNGVLECWSVGVVEYWVGIDPLFPHHSTTPSLHYSKSPSARPMSRILVKLVIDAVDQRLPTRLDHVVRYADRAPAFLAVARFDQNAHHRAGAFAGGQYADFVVEQLHLLERGIEFGQRAPER